jgi:SPX domain protein involved in polyphosphate accumulation
MLKKYFMEQNTERAVSKPLIYRKERKFVVTGSSITAVEFFIKGHPAMFFQPFPPRFVNNIYFDSGEFQNYGDNVIGSSNRHKFRIRWYGEQFGFVEKPVLEIKIKKGLAGAKRNFRLASFTIEPGFSQKDINAAFDKSDLPNEIREMLRYQSPTLLNRYHRKYFLSADRIFRVTLDYKLKYTRISRYQNSFMQRISNDRDVIVELKYDTKYDEEANKISASFPFRLSKNSKYVNGIDELDA